MPYLIRLSKEICDDFLTRPKTFVCCFPTGWDLYFTLPFNLDWLNDMIPGELGFFSAFLSLRQDDIAAALEDSPFDHVDQIKQAIERRRSAYLLLSPSEQSAWVNGYGVPVFNKAQQMVDFVVDHAHREFQDSVGSRSEAHRLEQAIRSPVRQTCTCFEDDNRAVIDINRDRDNASEARSNEATNPFRIHGGPFPDYERLARLESKCSDFELRMLREGKILVGNLPPWIWDLIEVLPTPSTDDRGQSTRAPETPSARQNLACDSSLLPEDARLEATNYACPSCETDAGTSRAGTPTLSETPQIIPAATTNDDYDDDAGSGSLQSEEDTSDTSSVAANGRHNPFHPKWKLPINMFGVVFPSFYAWIEFEKELSETELHLLSNGVLTLSGNFEDGIAYTPGPNAKARFCGARQAVMTRDNVHRRTKQDTRATPADLVDHGRSSGDGQGTRPAPTKTPAGSSPFALIGGAGYDEPCYCCAFMIADA